MTVSDGQLEKKLMQEPPEATNVAADVAAIRAMLLQLETQLTRAAELSRTTAIAARRIERSLLAAEDQRRDIMELMRYGGWIRPSEVRVEAVRRVAENSDDHISPRGTANDNTRHPQFVLAAERVLGANLTHLDVGCAGGGLVWDFTLRRHFSIGVEGSDYSQKSGRAEWRALPDRLFTADVTAPFRVLRRNEPLYFDIVSAWEFFEHIPEHSLPGVLQNIYEHLRPGGLLVCSIATFEDSDPVTGAVWHQTVRERDFWEAQMRNNGLEPIDSPFEIADYVRGAGNSRADDWDVRDRPDMGFHLVCRRG